MNRFKAIAALGVGMLFLVSLGNSAYAGPGDEDARPQGPPAVQGFVKGIQGNTLAVKTRHYQDGRDEVTVHLLPETTCKGRGVKDEAGCGAVQLGSRVSVWGQARQDGSVDARFMVIAAVIHPPEYRVWTGEILSLEGNEVSVRNRGGNTYEVMLTAETIFLPPSQSNLAVGDIITTIAHWDAQGLCYEAVVVLKRPAHP